MTKAILIPPDDLPQPVEYDSQDDIAALLGGPYDGVLAHIGHCAAWGMVHADEEAPFNPVASGIVHTDIRGPMVITELFGDDIPPQIADYLLEGAML